ncbi:MAG TPA: DNA alkylation repair protein [Streptosporangiaceae bacterium]
MAKPAAQPATSATSATSTAATAATAATSTAATAATAATSTAATTAADKIAAELRAAGQPERAVTEKAYLKSDLNFFGVGVPAARAIVRSWCRAHPDLGHDELTAVAAGLWARPDYECRMAAQMLLIQNPGLLGPADIPQLEQILRQARTWALVDGLTCDLMGPLVERYPELTGVLDRWAADPDFWIRRSALLSLLLPLRRGAGDFERFSRYADQMLDEREFFIRKAIGWVLRETAKRRPALVAGWLEPRITRLSGVTLREAVKPLPEPTRAALLARRQAG